MIKVGTRRSSLSLQQTKSFIQILGQPCCTIPMMTTGDKLSSCLKKAGGKGLFSKELHEKLLTREIDVAVHSLKDLETELPKGIQMACIFEAQVREDVLLARDSFEQLPKKAKAGTCSPRRQALLQEQFPSWSFVSYRGNVETRLQKLLHGEADVTVLALAGLIRLQLWKDGELIFQNQRINAKVLTLSSFPCAVGQGFLAATCREEDVHLFSHLNLATEIPWKERDFLKSLGGNCHTAVGVYFEDHFFKACYKPPDQENLIWNTSNTLEGLKNSFARLRV